MATMTSWRAQLAEWHLLQHPFYRAWTAGELDLAHLRLYARQYFHHVDAFPRYLSATHSNCPDLHARQSLLLNLREEEEGEHNHPELWLRFAEGLGETREEIRKEKPLPATRELVDGFMANARTSYPRGLGALFAYEQQVPDVAAAKSQGLRDHYGIDDARTIAFFEVHREADVIHTEALGELLDQLDDDGQKQARQASQQAAQALWHFLDGVMQAIH